LARTATDELARRRPEGEGYLGQPPITTLIMNTPVINKSRHGASYWEDRTPCAACGSGARPVGRDQNAPKWKCANENGNGYVGDNDSDKLPLRLRGGGDTNPQPSGSTPSDGCGAMDTDVTDVTADVNKRGPPSPSVTTASKKKTTMTKTDGSSLAKTVHQNIGFIEHTIAAEREKRKISVASADSMNERLLAIIFSVTCAWRIADSLESHSFRRLK